MSWDTPTMFKRKQYVLGMLDTIAISTWVDHACVLDEAPAPPDSGRSSSPNVLSAA